MTLILEKDKEFEKLPEITKIKLERILSKEFEDIKEIRAEIILAKDNSGDLFIPQEINVPLKTLPYTVYEAPVLYDDRRSPHDEWYNVLRILVKPQVGE